MLRLKSVGVLAHKRQTVRVWVCVKFRLGWLQKKSLRNFLSDLVVEIVGVERLFFRVSQSIVCS